MRLHITVVSILLCSVAGPGRAASATSQADSTSTFVGTTSAPAELLQFLGAPAGAKAELIEWSLSLGTALCSDSIPIWLRTRKHAEPMQSTKICTSEKGPRFVARQGSH